MVGFATPSSYGLRALSKPLRIDGNADEMVRLRLLEAHCLPILTYGIEIVHVSNRDDRRQLRVAYNSIFRNTIILCSLDTEECLLFY